MTTRRDISPEHGMNVSQQYDICAPHEIGPVIVIGIGSVGSQVAMGLARVGVTDLTIVDADRVESHNVPMSAFGVRDVGLLKVEVMAGRIAEDTGVRVKAVPCMYTNETLKGSVVACVDKMEARMAIWEQVRGNPLVPAFIDTRIANRLVHVHRLRPTNPEHVAFYQRRLYPTRDAAPPMCGLHGIIYVTGHAASIAVGSLVAIRQGIELHSPYEFSFHTVEQL